MGASKKGKRKIVVNDTTFYWYVKWDDSWWLENVIHILDINMQYLFYYIVGKEEVRIFDRWVKSPTWMKSNGLHDPECVETISPHIVAQIIKWCLENKENEQ